MKTLAWLIGALARRWMRAMVPWAETQYGRSAVRLFVYSNVLALSDEPALVGVEGKRRGHRLTEAGSAERFDAYWLPCARVWTLQEFGRRRGVLEGWTPPTRYPLPWSRRASR